MFSLLLLPAPRFYILYNGGKPYGYRVIKLSDSFRAKEPEPALELTAKVVDINYSSGEAVLKRSDSLHEHSFLVAEIRRNLHTGMTRDKAVAQAIQSCIDQEVSKDFLENQYSEVINMLNWEYDAEVEKRVLMLCKQKYYAKKSCLML